MIVAASRAARAPWGCCSGRARYGGVFNAAGGPIAYQNLFWFYGHPVVYVMFFPFVGAVAEVVATFSRRRFFGYRAVRRSRCSLFTALSMSVWAPPHVHHRPDRPNKYFSLTSTALVVPAGDRVPRPDRDDVGRRDPCSRTPMLFALGFIAAVPDRRPDAASSSASPPLDYHVTRHLLRRRPLPLHAVRGQPVRPLRRPLLLVAEGHRGAAARAASAGCTSCCWSSART